MNRNTRTLIVVAVALVAATIASWFVYQTIKRIPVREVEVAHVFEVVAARPLTLGARIVKEDVKLVAWPASSPIPNGFTNVDDVVNRGVIQPISENEPLTGRNIASAEAGAGLPPSIPPGMRAISLKVNEVIGVAGFVVPGTRVDVMVILRRGTENIARVVVSNAQVLTAGTRYDQEVAKEGNPIPSTVVTLMVTPEDAARIGLAGADGDIMLTLRNPLDVAPTTTAVLRSSTLSDGLTMEAPALARAQPEEPRRVIARPAPAPVTPPPAPVVAVPVPQPTPAPYKVETIRGAKRVQETIQENNR